MPPRNRRPSTAPKRKAAPPPAPTATPQVNGSPHPPSVPGLPQGAIDLARNGLALLGRPHEAPPATPHTTRLLIVRAPGGYTLFDADCIELTQADADPANAVGVASTGDDLARRIREWVNAEPAPKFEA